MNNTFDSFQDMILKTAAYSTCTVIAASLIGGPIGLVQAGVYGATGFLLSRPVTLLCDKVFNSNQLYASKISQIVSNIAAIILGSAAAWGIASLVGIKMTFTAALFLTGGTFAVAIGILTIAAILTKQNHVVTT
jgi:hypothetical protein